jgi:hypothetical protein
VEWLYSFDIHCNAFFPLFLILYVLQYFLLPFLLTEGFLPTLVSNSLYCVAFCYYHYITFLGYSGENVLSLCCSSCASTNAFITISASISARCGVLLVSLCSCDRCIHRFPPPGYELHDFRSWILLWMSTIVHFLLASKFKNEGTRSKSSAAEAACRRILPKQNWICYIRIKTLICSAV